MQNLIIKNSDILKSLQKINKSDLFDSAFSDINTFSSKHPSMQGSSTPASFTKSLEEIAKEYNRPSEEGYFFAIQCGKSIALLHYHDVKLTAGQAPSQPLKASFDALISEAEKIISKYYPDRAVLVYKAILSGCDYSSVHQRRYAYRRDSKRISDKDNMSYLGSRMSYGQALNAAAQPMLFICPVSTISDLLYPENLYFGGALHGSAENEIALKKAVLNNRNYTEFNLTKAICRAITDFRRTGNDQARNYLLASGSHALYDVLFLNKELLDNYFDSSHPTIGSMLFDSKYKQLADRYITQIGDSQILELTRTGPRVLNSLHHPNKLNNILELADSTGSTPDCAESIISLERFYINSADILPKIAKFDHNNRRDNALGLCDTCAFKMLCLISENTDLPESPDVCRNKAVVEAISSLKVNLPTRKSILTVSDGIHTYLTRSGLSLLLGFSVFGNGSDPEDWVSGACEAGTIAAILPESLLAATHGAPSYLSDSEVRATEVFESLPREYFFEEIKKKDLSPVRPSNNSYDGRHLSVYRMTQQEVAAIIHSKGGDHSSSRLTNGLHRLLTSGRYPVSNVSYLRAHEMLKYLLTNDIHALVNEVALNSQSSILEDYNIAYHEVLKGLVNSKGFVSVNSKALSEGWGAIKSEIFELSLAVETARSEKTACDDSYITSHTIAKLNKLAGIPSIKRAVDYLGSIAIHEMDNSVCRREYMHLESAYPGYLNTLKLLHSKHSYLIQAIHQLNGIHKCVAPPDHRRQHISHRTCQDLIHAISTITHEDSTAYTIADNYTDLVICQKPVDFHGLNKIKASLQYIQKTKSRTNLAIPEEWLIAYYIMQDFGVDADTVINYLKVLYLFGAYSDSWAKTDSECFKPLHTSYERLGDSQISTFKQLKNTESQSSGYSTLPLGIKNIATNETVYGGITLSTRKSHFINECIRESVNRLSAMCKTHINSSTPLQYAITILNNADIAQGSKESYQQHVSDMLREKQINVSVSEILENATAHKIMLNAATRYNMLYGLSKVTTEDISNARSNDSRKTDWMSFSYMSCPDFSADMDAAKVIIPEGIPHTYWSEALSRSYNDATIPEHCFPAVFINIPPESHIADNTCFDMALCEAVVYDIALLIDGRDNYKVLANIKKAHEHACSLTKQSVGWSVKTYELDYKTVRDWRISGDKNQLLKLDGRAMPAYSSEVVVGARPAGSLGNYWQVLGAQTPSKIEDLVISELLTHKAVITAITRQKRLLRHPDYDWDFNLVQTDAEIGRKHERIQLRQLMIDQAFNTEYTMQEYYLMDYLRNKYESNTNFVGKVHRDSSFRSKADTNTSEYLKEDIAQTLNDGPVYANNAPSQITQINNAAKVLLYQLGILKDVFVEHITQKDGAVKTLIYWTWHGLINPDSCLPYSVVDNDSGHGSSSEMQLMREAGPTIKSLKVIFTKIGDRYKIENSPFSEQPVLVSDNRLKLEIKMLVQYMMKYAYKALLASELITDNYYMQQYLPITIPTLLMTDPMVENAIMGTRCLGQNTGHGVDGANSYKDLVSTPDCEKLPVSVHSPAISYNTGYVVLDNIIKIENPVMEMQTNYTDRHNLSRVKYDVIYPTLPGMKGQLELKSRRKRVLVKAGDKITPISVRKLSEDITKLQAMKECLESSITVITKATTDPGILKSIVAKSAALLENLIQCIRRVSTDYDDMLRRVIKLAETRIDWCSILAPTDIESIHNDYRLREALSDHMYLTQDMTAIAGELRYLCILNKDVIGENSLTHLATADVGIDVPKCIIHPLTDLYRHEIKDLGLDNLDFEDIKKNIIINTTALSCSDNVAASYSINGDSTSPYMYIPIQPDEDSECLSIRVNMEGKLSDFVGDIYQELQSCLDIQTAEKAANNITKNLVNYIICRYMTALEASKEAICELLNSKTQLLKGEKLYADPDMKDVYDNLVKFEDIKYLCYDPAATIRHSLYQDLINLDI